MWKRTSKKGAEFFTGNINLGDSVLEFVVFSNDKGDNPKRPDFRIYRSEPRPELNANGTEKVAEPSDGVPF